MPTLPPKGPHRPLAHPEPHRTCRQGGWLRLEAGRLTVRVAGEPEQLTVFGVCDRCGEAVAVARAAWHD